MIFVTGGLRSGTTLLANLIGVLEQPFPLLFVEAKRAFLRECGVPRDDYPIGHGFHDGDPGAEALDLFLRGWRTCSEDLARLFDAMRSYSGQKRRFTADELQRALRSIAPDDDFAAVSARLVESAGSIGSKEVFCEEFLPHLLGRGARCILIVRDPRDVLASLNHGRGREFGGELRPTLFNVRSWRKSVAFGLAMESHPRFVRCRYEDLVADPVSALSAAASALAIDAVSVPAEIRDSAGEVWRGNSSHGEHRGIGTSSVGAHGDVLPPEVAAFVEATCLPELVRLGYSTTMTLSDAIATIESFADPYKTTRSGLEGDAMTPSNARLEVERLERVSAAPDSASQRWFLFESAHAALRETFRP